MGWVVSGHIKWTHRQLWFIAVQFICCEEAFNRRIACVWMYIWRSAKPAAPRHLGNVRSGMIDQRWICVASGRHCIAIHSSRSCARLSLLGINDAVVSRAVFALWFQKCTTSAPRRIRIMWMLTVVFFFFFIVQTLSFMHCTCNFICGLSDVIIKTFSQSVSQNTTQTNSSGRAQSVIKYDTTARCVLLQWLISKPIF